MAAIGAVFPNAAALEGYAAAGVRIWQTDAIGSATKTVPSRGKRSARCLPHWLTGTIALNDRIERCFVGGTAATTFKHGALLDRK
jgi:hypothetical protein